MISRKQLVALGLDAAGIDNRVKIGFLRVVHRGVYAVGHDAIPIRGRLCAALLVAGPQSALSHRTAAYVLTLLPSMPPFVEITTTNRRRRPRTDLVFHHATHLHTTTRHGLPVTTAMRTLLDLAAAGAHDLERAASEALVLKLVTKQQFKHQRGPGAARLRRLILGATRSRLERAFLRAVVAAGLPEPISGFRIGPYTVDFLWPSHDLVVETDGADYHDHVLAERRDGTKDAHLRHIGYTVLRVPENRLPAAPAIVAGLLSRPASRRAS